jgi:hypothetical protein
VATLVRIFRRLDRPLFLLWAGLCTLMSARTFYGYMLKQTGGGGGGPHPDPVKTDK